MSLIYTEDNGRDHITHKEAGEWCYAHYRQSCYLRSLR